MNPDIVLSWWNVVNTVGLPGVLLAEIALLFWLLKKYLPAVLQTWREWIIAIDELAEELERWRERNGKRDSTDQDSGK